MGECVGETGTETEDPGRRFGLGMAMLGDDDFRRGAWWSEPRATKAVVEKTHELKIRHDSSRK